MVTMRRYVLPCLVIALFTITAGSFAASPDMQANIKAQGLLLTLFGIFCSGMLISLTPCVYPMIPITLSIIGARSAESRPIVGFTRSLVFVLGIATIYTVLGMIVALSGGTVGFLLQSKGFLLGLSLLFIVLGLSMLGLFNLQLPPAIAAKIQGNGSSRGGFVGAFFLGITTGVVASPCGSPVLVSILALAGAQGQPELGAVMLFSYALGIGMLFLVLGTFPAFLNKVPKSGVWMEDIKKMMGLVLIVASFYYLSFALPRLLVWGMLIATTIIFAAMILMKSRERAQWPRLQWGWRLAALSLLIVAGYASFSAVPGIVRNDRIMAERQANTIRSLRAAVTSGTLAQAPGEAAAPPDYWLDDEPAALAMARENGWPVMIDFGAEWCAACKQLERRTFPDPDVEKALEKFVKVKIDCTDDTEETQALQKKYNSVSLPTVVFIGADGEWQEDLTLLDFEAPAEFLERLAKVNQEP